jgi:hypothetical protein
MINTKVKKAAATEPATDDKLMKLLESMDWKLWEIMNMLKDNLPEKSDKKPKKTV